LKKGVEQMSNKETRQLFEEVLIKFGLKMKFVSEKLGFENTTVSKWRNGHLDYGQIKLNQINSFLNTYLHRN
jgi:hypothetical protein